MPKTLPADEVLKGKQLSLLFFLKLLAIPTYYLMYKYFYGGIEQFDSGVFFRDAAELNRFGKEHPADYLRALLGLQDDSNTSYFFKNYISRSNNWDNGRVRILFYNDNRIVIRLHSLIHFLAFGSYFVHALFSCFLSFLGSFWIYSSIKNYFKGKEFMVLVVLCCFPSLWLHTGALLKEGIALFVLGANTLLLKKLIQESFRLKYLFLFLPGLALSFLLKPYLLLGALFCFALLFFLERTSVKLKGLVFFGLLFLGLVMLDLCFRMATSASLSDYAAKRQSVFRDAAKGGIFLIDSVKFVRLDYNFDLVEKVAGKGEKYRIKPGAPFVYWEHHHQQDTLFCGANQDSLQVYELAYSMRESSSNLPATQAGSTVVEQILESCYRALLFPLWPDPENPKLILAILENLVLLCSLVILCSGLILSKKNRFPVLVVLSFVLLEGLLIAYTSPNTGAILRYRGPVVVFLPLWAVYYLKGPLRGTRSESPEL